MEVSQCLRPIAALETLARPLAWPLAEGRQRVSPVETDRASAAVLIPVAPSQFAVPDETAFGRLRLRSASIRLRLKKWIDSTTSDVAQWTVPPHY